VQTVLGWMAKPLVPDELWTLIEPLLPPERRPSRAALTGILFVLKSGLSWEMLPQEMGCGSGMTCWRRLRDWQALVCWYLEQAASRPARLPGPGQCHRLEPRLRGQRVCCGKRGEKTGHNPTDCGRAGSKRHVIADANGVPLALRITAANIHAANIHDSRLFEELIDAVPPIRHGVGRPQRRPAKLHADKGYDFPHCRRRCVGAPSSRGSPGTGSTAPSVWGSIAG
jgi:transposase